MADITLYKPATVTAVVVDGTPPPDQQAIVAKALADAQAGLTQANSTVAACQAALTAAQADVAAFQQIITDLSPAP